MKDTQTVSMSDLKKIELKDEKVKKLVNPINLKGRSFFLFGPKNKIRYFGA